MSPAKKTTKKKAKPKRQATKSKVTKKKATSKPTASKAKQKPAKKVTAKAAAAKRQTAEKSARKAASKATAPQRTADEGAAKKAPAQPAAKTRVAPAPRPAAPLAAITAARPDAHPKLGVKHTCFACGAKFYDLFRPEPLCPKCGADQRDAPKPDSKHVPSPKVGRRAKRPMEPLLADEDDDVVFDDDEAKGLDLGQAGADLDDPAEESEDDTDL